MISKFWEEKKHMNSNFCRARFLSSNLDGGLYDDKIGGH